jgi:hypothetical protein
MIRQNVNGIPKPGIKSASNRGKGELNNRGARRKLLLLPASEKKILLLKQRKKIIKRK